MPHAPGHLVRQCRNHLWQMGVVQTRARRRATPSCTNDAAFSRARNHNQTVPCPARAAATPSLGLGRNMGSARAMHIKTQAITTRAAKKRGDGDAKRASGLGATCRARSRVRSGPTTARAASYCRSLSRRSSSLRRPVAPAPGSPRPGPCSQRRRRVTASHGARLPAPARASIRAARERGAWGGV